MSSPSPSASGSSRSSATSEPTISVKKTSKKSKDKGKQKSSTGEGKNEGVDQNWAYKPPAGAVLIEEDVDAGEFDWDKVNGDDVELWLIRVPESVKPKYLENLQVEVPSSSKSTRIGSVKRKHATFDIWSVGENDDDLPVGGEEIKNISCLLPKKGKKGKLYPAPKPFACHLVIAAQAVVPSPITPSESGPDPETGKYKSVPRQRYPAELLKHRFMPYGSVGGVDESVVNGEDVAMDVDVEEVPSPKKQKKVDDRKKDEAVKEKDTKKSPVVETKKSKGKKRKGDADEDVTATPVHKKSKKAKTSSCDLSSLALR
ncbi:hypothetical protein K443DRAFT_114158 [Laccaria amethystina LaAM-08-1]|uniref:DNA-directed RNA polymerase I subunit RPA34 n=1 Tax=Laccaria amethystina LaAM-08-1 TaxID=1095629 RepID=A0A0C9WHZ8_9AGAR|nr:hypothetical protein K443DRAFT_114158 [Laccaria amethystina LaAM-08-1]